jgi:hypothetical protein
VQRFCSSAPLTLPSPPRPAGGEGETQAASRALSKPKLGRGRGPAGKSRWPPSKELSTDFPRTAPQPHGTVHLKKGQVSGYDRVSWMCVIAFRRDGVMGLFPVLFWCSAVAGGILRFNSRFGVFNSRLGRRQFPFSPTTGIGRQGLDLVRCLRHQNGRYRGKSEKFPVPRDGVGSHRNHLSPFLCLSRGVHSSLSLVGF